MEPGNEIKPRYFELSKFGLFTVVGGLDEVKREIVENDGKWPSTSEEIEQNEDVQYLRMCEWIRIKTVTMDDINNWAKSKQIQNIWYSANLYLHEVGI